MLSVIVCSVNNEKLELLRNNISTTIGLQFEWINVGDESSNKGICELYNEGVGMSKGDILCFCHDDIRFDTPNWGLELIRLCSNEQNGLVGVAGAVYKSEYPTAWIDVPNSYYRVNMTQIHSNGSETKYRILNTSKEEEVVVLDGCFIAGRREVFESFPWNSRTLKGFHLYDIDLSIRVAQQFKLIVAGSISLSHFSEGNFGSSWLEDSETNHKTNRNLLPLKTNAVNKKEAKRLDYYSLTQFSKTLIRLRKSRYQVWKYGSKAIFKYPTMKSNYVLLKLMFKYLITGKRCIQ